MASTRARGTTAPASLDPAVERLIDAFEAAIPQAAKRTAEAIRAEIPSYQRITGPELLEDVRMHVQLNLEAMERSLRQMLPVTLDELVFLRAPTTRRARLGLPLADYLHAFRIGLRVAWETVLAGASDSASRQAALSLTGPVLEFVNVLSTHAAEAYIEIEQLLLAEGERVRRDLLGDLLAGIRPPAGPREDALRAAGLTAEGTHVVISALATGDGAEEHALRAVAAILGCAGNRTTKPLAVIRGDEVIAIVPAQPARAQALADTLRNGWTSFADENLTLAIGTSTIAPGLDQLPAAYREACEMRPLTGPDGGVVCLFELTPFDYLTLVGNQTAARLISPDIARFVAEDIADGGVLTTTLLQYAAADLNAKAAAERLHIHVNTAHYRLARIAERTSRDLRRLNDIIELLIAVRLAHGRTPATSALDLAAQTPARG
jgi:hypothetical protein